jgi:hypothetical protein
MTLSHNHSQPRDGPDQTQPSSVGAAPVFITGIGLCSQPGTEPVALFGAVGTHLSGARSHDCLDAPLPGEKDRAPILFSPVSHLQGLETPHDRIAALAQTALEAAANQLTENISGESILQN